MREFKTVSLADQVFERLEQDIITGLYPRGDILTELKLVEQLGVSRTPIREALRRLEQEQLIRDTGKGSLVLGITLEDLVDIMDIRCRVEGLAAYYATKNMTDDGLNELRQISELQDFYLAKSDTEKLRQLDDQFHVAIYTLSGRNLIRDTLQPLHRKAQRYRALSIADPVRQEKSIEEHKAIFQAMAAGDAELADRLTALHIRNAEKNMIERFHYHG